MKLGLVYDLRDDYRASGFTEEESAEFDSAETIDALARSLVRLGWDVDRVGRGQELARRLSGGEKFNLVFSIAEGVRGRSREAQVPALCEMFDQPYVFSDPLTMATTLDKAVAKRIVRDCGVPTASFVVIENAFATAPDILYPAFIKPLAEGTGKGCGGKSLVHNAHELRREAARLIDQFKQPVIVESYLPGREFTVGIVGSGDNAEVIAVLEVAVRPDADKGVYSFEIKEDWERYVTLDVADDSEARMAAKIGLSAYRALGCRDAGRVDVKSTDKGKPQFLEINPIAGLHPTHSDLPILTTKSGRDYDWLISEIISSACSRYGIKQPTRRREYA